MKRIAILLIFIICSCVPIHHGDDIVTKITPCTIEGMANYETTNNCFFAPNGMYNVGDTIYFTNPKNK